jgi:hypothetical protein
MPYIEKIHEAQKKAFSHSVATKILDLMDKLRLNSIENDSRRWIWELLQNAKDVSNDSGKIAARINLDLNNGLLEFSHNGKPFTSENITFLIEQVSSKDRKKNEESIVKSTGKFGTGFLTTHLLSEIVSISGVLKESDEPYKKFDITLDRSGRDIDSIIASVERSLLELNRIDTAPNMDNFLCNNFNTKFKYELDEIGFLIAEKGIKDLFNSLPFTMVFLPEIESVYIDNLNVRYELGKDYLCLNENIKLYIVNEYSNSLIKEHKIIVLSKNNVTIAVRVEEIDNRIFLNAFGKSVPKLFCNFPLVGTENFPFPFIINSHDFNPTEPRDGVYLTDKNEEKIAENKFILLHALELYYELLDFAAQNNWGNLHLFAAMINSTLDVGWLSNKWLENEIIKPIKNKLLYVPMIDTQMGQRVAIKNKYDEFSIWFPSHKDSKIRNKIWDLCRHWIPSMLPLQVDVDNWYSVLWSECKNLTLETISNSLQSTGELTSLETKLVSSINVTEWLNSFFKLLDEESKFIENIIGDKYSVIPNQNGIFKKRSEIKYDDNIDEELKVVLCTLGQDCRDSLLHKNVITKSLQYESLEQKDVINKINEMILDQENKYTNVACFYLISLFADDIKFPKERETIYNFCKSIFPTYVHEKRELINWSKNIWEYADFIIIKNLIKEISMNINMENLNQKYLFTGYNETLQWLNNFVSFLSENGYDNLLNNSNKAILPNQKGNFVIKDELFLDDNMISDDLKDIAFDLGYDIRNELLCVEIFLELPESRTKTQKDVADEISNKVRKKLRELPDGTGSKQIFRRLLLWFNENEEKAKELFPDLYKNKHKLYDDIEIAENMEKAVKYDEIMDKFNIKNYETLEEILETTMSYTVKNQNNKQVITENILAQMGIFSQGELEEAFQDEIFSDNFNHITDKEIFKFEYVQNIIKRSIDNVLKYLGSQAEYNLEGCEEIAKTIYSVSKNGEDIYIIIRPSDYKQIIIYYDSEKDLLDYEKDCELWVDDGLSIPQKITFGKILKITGINKIPLKKIR